MSMKSEESEMSERGATVNVVKHTSTHK